MLSKIDRLSCFQRYPKFPWSKYHGNKYFFPPVYGQYTITLNSKTVKSHAKNIGSALQLLVEQMKFDALMFIGDSTLPWLYRANDFDYKPVADAFEYLKNNGISKTFNGGVVLTVTGIAEFTKHLFWLTRTNGIVQYVYAMDENQQILLRVCQHGSIHFYTLDDATDKLFNEKLPASGLHLLDSVTCYEAFGKHGQIAHRTIVL